LRHVAQPSRSVPQTCAALRKRPGAFCRLAHRRANVRECSGDLRRVAQPFGSVPETCASRRKRLDVPPFPTKHTVQLIPLQGNVDYHTYWLKDFNIRFIQKTTTEQEFKQKQDTTYTNNLTGKFEYPSVTVNLSSSNESGLTRSKLLHGEEIIDTFNYVLPMGGNTFSIIEKPEHHIIRMITQYVSRIKSIDDILDVDSFEWTKTYHGHRLWCNSLEYHILDDTIECRYFYNDIHYSEL
jgi:hypothetical protein